MIEYTNIAKVTNVRSDLKIHVVETITYNATDRTIVVQYKAGHVLVYKDVDNKFAVGIIKLIPFSNTGVL